MAIEALQTAIADGDAEDVKDIGLTVEELLRPTELRFFAPDLVSPVIPYRRAGRPR